MPQVSVVISTYNRSGMLSAALCSALSQRDVEVEVVVVDNGSTDDTAQMLAGWHDQRLRVIRNHESLGPIGGRNTGLSAARGEWVGVLDDDDLWAPDKMREQLDAAESTGRDWVYAGCVHIDGRGRVLGGRPPPTPGETMAELPTRFVLPGGISNVVWRRGTLDGDGLLDPRLPFPADWDVSLRLARRGPPAATMRPLVAYRQHGSNMSRRSARHQRELAILERKRADLDPDHGIDWGAHHRFVGSEQLRAGSRFPALRAYVRAVAAGDLGSLPRAAGTALPQGAQRWVRRTLLSKRAWVAEAEGWLAVLDAAVELKVPARA
jgi:glycosyltransferase involved in cell wall biosynthesis